MPHHSCIDPHDPDAQREVLVEFEGGPFDVWIIAAINEANDDILLDLFEEQVHDLQREIAAFYKFDRSAFEVGGQSGRSLSHN